VFGILGYLILIWLPGAWITFGLRLSGFPFWARLLVGAVLSPVVVCLQFYTIRLLGAPFELTAILLPVLNLPALYLVLRHHKNVSRPDGRLVAGWLLVLFVPFVFMAPALIDTQGQIFTGHAWSYSDPAYTMANGSLILEEPELAGVRLAYPWLGLVYQGILSYLVDTPPAASYIWTNMLWLFFIFGFVSAMVAELGGNRFSRVTSVIWLAFGVNFVGFVLWRLALGVELVGTVLEFIVRAVRGNFYLDILGDPRYTPWLIKFLFFEQEPLALGLFAAIAFFLVRRWHVDQDKDYLVMIGILLVASGILYPPLFPAAGALAAARIAALFLERRHLPKEVAQGWSLGLGIGLVLAVIATLVYLRFLTVDRVSRAVYLPWEYGLGRSLRKAITSVVVTFPLVVGLPVTFSKLWNSNRTATVVLLLGALASAFLMVIFWLPGFRNEYKFIFTAAICLAPFPSLALEPFMDRLGRKAWPVFGVIMVLLASPLAIRLNSGWPWFGTTYDPVPKVDAANFELRLRNEETLSGLSNAIRDQTPPDSILVMKSADLHFPTLTSRGLYVPPDQSAPHPGVFQGLRKSDY
jgi:hypothetical protein